MLTDDEREPTLDDAVFPLALDDTSCDDDVPAALEEATPEDDDVEAAPPGAPVHAEPTTPTTKSAANGERVIRWRYHR